MIIDLFQVTRFIQNRHELVRLMWLLVWSVLLIFLFLRSNFGLRLVFVSVLLHLINLPWLLRIISLTLLLRVRRSHWVKVLLSLHTVLDEHIVVGLLRLLVPLLQILVINILHISVCKGVVLVLAILRHRALPFLSLVGVCHAFVIKWHISCYSWRGLRM